VSSACLPRRMSYVPYVRRVGSKQCVPLRHSSFVLKCTNGASPRRRIEKSSILAPAMQNWDSSQSKAFDFDLDWEGLKKLESWRAELMRSDGIHISDGELQGFMQDAGGICGGLFKAVQSARDLKLHFVPAKVREPATEDPNPRQRGPLSPDTWRYSTPVKQGSTARSSVMLGMRSNERRSVLDCTRSGGDGHSSSLPQIKRSRSLSAYTPGSSGSPNGRVTLLGARRDAVDLTTSLGGHCSMRCQPGPGGLSVGQVFAEVLLLMT
jgi:hypothetical protein